MSASMQRRLPAYDKQVRDKLSAGMLPAIGGNTIAVCIGWPARCVFAHVVCVPEDRPPDQWDFDFLDGVESIVWFNRFDRGYAEEVRRELVNAGCPIVAMLQVPEVTQ